jgi:hypothetical protein
MAFVHSPKIVTDGLILCLDAANPRSYVSGSTVWNNLVNSTISGSLTNGPTYSSANLGSIVFDGTNDYVNVSSAQSLNPGTGSYSLECWCKTNQQLVGTGIVEARGASLWGFLFLVDYPSSNKIGFIINPNDQASQKIYSSTTSPVVTGSWQHVAATVNKSTNQIAFYYNGQQTGNLVSLTFSGSIDPGSSYRYWVGGDLGGNEMNGNISISRQYNRALSATEVLQNYNATKGRYGL